MKKFALVLAVVLMTGTVSAITQSELDYFKDRYNNQTSKVPSVVGNIVGGEKLNVYVNHSNDTEVIGADMQGLEISEIVKGGYSSRNT